MNTPNQEPPGDEHSQSTGMQQESAFPTAPNTWIRAAIAFVIVLAAVAVIVWLVLRSSDDPDANNANSSSGTAGASAEEAPATDVILTTFQWNWESVARECPATIAPAGFRYVQISPPNETIQGEAWWTSYQPVSYKLESKLGTPEEFQHMIDACKEVGVGIIADAVLNHMAAVDQAPGTGVAGSTFAEDDFPGIYGYDDFNECRTNISTYRDRDEVQGCRLLGLQDLATSHENVQDTEAAYLNELIAMGVEGFRIDAAKHMPEADLAAIKAKLSDPNILWIQEVIRGVEEPIKPEEYEPTGKVNEFGYGRDLVDDFNNQIAALKYAGKGLLPSADAVVFVDNHDTERDGSTLNYKAGNDYLLANIFMLGWDYGEPAVYTGYEFDDKDAGAPGATATSVPDVDCGSDQWTCLQNWPEIQAMVHFHNTAAGTPVTNWWSNDSNVIAFARGGEKSTQGPTDPISGDSGAATVFPADLDERDITTVADVGSGAAFLVINNEDSTYVAGSGKDADGDFGKDNPYAKGAPGSPVDSGSLSGPAFLTSLPAGRYCNVMVPDCAEVITVGKDGSFAAQIPAGKALALHIGAQK